MEKAAQLTQSAMDARGVAKDHFVSSINVSPGDFYIASVQALGEGESPAPAPSLFLYIHTDGSVVWKEMPPSPPRLARAAAPAISIEKAAQLAQGELETRGVARDHFLQTLGFLPVGQGKACYTVRINPPIPDPSDGSKHLDLKINMDGSVTSHYTGARTGAAQPRVRVVPNPAAPAVQ